MLALCYVLFADLLKCVAGTRENRRGQSKLSRAVRSRVALYVSPVKVSRWDSSCSDCSSGWISCFSWEDYADEGWPLGSKLIDLDERAIADLLLRRFEKAIRAT